MAEIDPSIALSYRPPNLAQMPNLQIQTPLEGLAKVVSLRSLMQEGQLKGLQLQQLRTQMQEQQAYSNLLSGLAGNNPPTTQTTLQPGIVPQPAAGAYSGGAPPLTAGTLMTGSGGTLQGASGAPQTATVVPAQTTTADASQTTLQPGIVPAPAVQQPTAVTQPAGGGPREPTDAEILRVAPTTGPALIQKRNEQRKAALDLHIAGLEDAKKQTEDMSRLALASTDNNTFQKNMVEAANKGYISSDDARRYIALGFDDPKTQEWLNGAQMQTVTADKRQEMNIARAKEARDILQFGPAYRKSEADARQAERQGAAQTVDQVQDNSGWGKWLQQQGPSIADSFSSVINSNLPLEQKKAIIKRAGEEKVQQAADIAAGKQQVDIAPYKGIIDSVNRGEVRPQDLDPKTLETITPYLNVGTGGAGTAQPPAATQPQPQSQTPQTQAPAGGTGGGAPPQPAPKPTPVKLGKLMSDEARNRVATYDRATAILTEALGKVKDPNNADLMGPVAGDLAKLQIALPEWVQKNIPGAQQAAHLGDQSRNLRDYLTAVQTALRRFNADGSIKGLNPEVLDKLTPTIKTRPAEALGQIQQLLNLVAGERDSFLKTQSDKVLPPEMQPPTPAPAAAPKTAPTPAPTKPSPVGPSKTSNQIPADAAAALKDKGWGKLTLPDGRVYYKHKDGSITAGQ